MNFSGSLKDGKEFNFSVKLLAILHHLELKGINNSSVNVLNEFAVEQDINYAKFITTMVVSPKYSERNTLLSQLVAVNS